MLGDNCTRVAVKLLTSISLGRGAQLAQDTVCACVSLCLCLSASAQMNDGEREEHITFTVVCVFQQGFSDSRYGDIILVRPMRDYSAKEIAYYNHMFRVPYVFIPGLDTKVRSDGFQCFDYHDN